MSGPKKADVEAALNVARDVQRRCDSLISKAEDAMISSMLQDVDKTLRQVNSKIQELRGNWSGISPEVRGAAGGAANRLEDELGRALRMGEDAGRSTGEARRRVDEAGNEARQTENIYHRANETYERAATSLRNSGEHNLNREMEWAKEARKLYDEAASGLQRASGTRKQAGEAARSALQKAREALAAADNLARQVKAVRTEGEANLRAEEEARRIVEQKRRDALLAVEKIKSALEHVSDMPHQKFFPGEFDAIRTRQREASGRFDKGDYDGVKGLTDRLSEDTRRLEEKLTQAVREYERRRSEAETALNGLSHTIASVDATLVGEWGNDAAAYNRAQEAMAQARGAFAAESFEQTARLADEAARHLKDTMRSAAENKTANEKREQIGDAVMEVLEDLGFEVSWEPGTRIAPLRISGMTPDQHGKGDFDIVIPLDGQVDFEINTPSGDTTCVAAVEALQKRLAERGIARWQTTDWGHAHGSQPIMERIRTMEKEKIKTKMG